MMFQRAPPEEIGFGVMTSTPFLVRSAQPVMCLGLPLRTTSTTTESVTLPLYGPVFQLGATRPAFASRLTSEESEKATTSADSPLATARDWSPEAP